MRVCSRTTCHMAGIPQPDENFYRNKYECKVCSQLAGESSRLRRVEKLKHSNFAVDRERRLRLPIGPWRLWLTDQIALDGMMWVTHRLGVHERVIYRWLHESQTCDLDSVDRALCAAGCPWVLRELYPQLYAFGDEVAA